MAWFIMAWQSRLDDAWFVAELYGPVRQSWKGKSSSVENGCSEAVLEGMSRHVWVVQEEVRKGEAGKARCALARFTQVGRSMENYGRHVELSLGIEGCVMVCRVMAGKLVHGTVC